MTYELPFDDAYEPYHASSPTDRVILELQMYGHRPHQDEPDARPLPDDEVIRAEPDRDPARAEESGCDAQDRTDKKSGDFRKEPVRQVGKEDEEQGCPDDANRSSRPAESTEMMCD